VDKAARLLGTLIAALFYDLTMGKSKFPQAVKSGNELRDLIKSKKSGGAVCG